MNKKFISHLFFAGSIVLFSGCSETNTTEKKEASVVTTTGGTTSGSSQETTSGHMHEEGMSPLMKSMHSTMEQMKQMKMTGDPDYDFASMMIEHHKGGMEMSQYEIDNGKNQELVKLAQQINQEQEKELKEFKNFVSSHNAVSQNNSFMEEMNKHIQKGEQDMKGMKMSGNVDQDFARMMAMHHKHGIDMAKTEVKYGKDPKLKGMAKKTIEEQQKEIKKLESLKNNI